MRNRLWNDSHLWSRNERQSWLAILVMGTAGLYASRTAVPLLIPAISTEKKWSKADSGAVLSSFFWGYTLTQVLGGYLADFFGGHKVILLAAMGWASVTLVMPLVISTSDRGLWLVIVVRVAHGAFQGFHFPGMSSLASKQIAERDRASFFSLATSSSSVGTLLTGIIGSFILDIFDWKAVLYVVGLLSCVWTVFLHRKISYTTFTSAASSSDVASVPWSVIFCRSEFWALTVAHACQNNCFFTLISWLPTYFHETYPSAPGWVVNMVPWLLTVPCTILGKWMSEKLTATGYSVTNVRKLVETACLLTQALGLLALDMTSTLGGALLCIVLTIGATGFHNSAVVVNPTDLAPRYAGSVFGLMNTAGSIPGFLGVFVAGQVLEQTHSWSLVFRGIAAVNVFGLLVYVREGWTTLNQVTESYYHLETPHWDSVTKAVYLVDQIIGYVLKYDPVTMNMTRAYLGSGNVCPILTVEGSNDTFVAGRGRELIRFRWDGVSETPADVTVLVTLDQQYPENYIYGGKADSKGRIWIGTTNLAESGTGGLYLIEPLRNYSVTKKKSVIRASGMEWNDEDDTFYLIDSPTKNITVHQYASNTANLGAGEYLFSPGGFVMGGVTIDNTTQLWYTGSVDFGTGYVANVNITSAESNTFMNMWPIKVTNLGWGGVNSDVLYVTTSRAGMTDNDVAFHTGSGAMFTFTDMSIYGRPPYKVRLPQL